MTPAPAIRADLSGAVRPIVDWIGRETLVVLSALSLVSFVIGILLVPFVILRLPADYFVPERRSRPPSPRHPFLRATLRVGKNALGAVLVLLGAAMLVLPGQGLVTLLVGLMVMDFPGKFRLERRVLSFPRVLGAINAVRERAGKPPMRLPRDDD